ncbi:[NiFe]-hydrogenase assembly chaperone HybE [Cereibacter sphaeroides]|uniref:[NiFe]-hydrogenase assembly chaperone HybE n=1 Tax=Cereibacter sphaeroides TaxID=1063 RepID=UPI001F35BE5A|nr:[NiFe]-hydrogenase assembly chaperone HybE [Cereibacter sphaeroides]MCE6957936.1 [NiFe]-hydrogenase assembly chaperone HybE [Cereibacter sphaeroides]MCE6967981.1 [NiFe]-hydrogenase assembly chaperone HybE [Cereibacter sphaeroides]MCE6972313.1 [NiFe]-hydrogenase assembly chaperone HybE [Cereibacter sphaeroides]
MSGFEGSYLGANDRIGALAVMECKICWTPYDPAVGDDFRQILPGTPFSALPEDWGCPNCGAPKNQFMVLADPEAEAASGEVAERVARLVSDFEDIWHSRMRDVPLVNKSLHVEAVGFRLHEGRPLGVLVAPWFMNLVMLPGPDEDWSALTPGAKEQIAFPSGEYEFIHNVRAMGGGYKACSLFSPMSDFNSQLQAVEVARAVMLALFDEGVRAETDRAADIRALREAELAPPPPPALDPEPSRRAVITAGMAEG